MISYAFNHRGIVCRIGGGGPAALALCIVQGACQVVSWPSTGTVLLDVKGISYCHGRACSWHGAGVREGNGSSWGVALDLSKRTAVPPCFLAGLLEMNL